MATVPSANNQDPTLYFRCIGGPKDGFKSGDLPAHFSGQPLTGMVFKSPMSEPHQYSLYASYECVGEAQVNGLWEFYFQGMEGPNGEMLVAKADAPALSSTEDVVSAAERILSDGEGIGA